MPLEKFDTPQFLFRRRLFLDPYVDFITPGQPMSDTTVEVPFNPGKVQSLEISDYAIPRNYTSAVLVDENRDTINSFIDLRIQDYPVVTNTLDFSIRVPVNRSYTGATIASVIPYTGFLPGMATIDTFLDTMAENLTIAMDQENDAFFNTGNNWAFVVTRGEVFPSGRYGNIHINLQQNGVADTGTVQSLGATGPNADNYAHEIFGLTEGVDTPATQIINGTTYTGLIPSSYINVFPYRYVDFTFDEIPELTPHSRIWNTSTIDYSMSRWCVEKPRLLTDPPRRLDRLTVRVRLPNNLLPNILSFKSWNLTLEALLVSPETEIPGWVQQFINFD